MGTETARAPLFDVFNPMCPTRQVLDLIGDRWTVLIVITLLDGTKRFGELREAVPQITPKALTSALRAMERDGLVERRIYAEVPPRVEYTLTALGRTLEGPVRAVRDWAEQHMPEIQRARAAADRKGAR